MAAVILVDAFIYVVWGWNYAPVLGSDMVVCIVCKVNIQYRYVQIVTFVYDLLYNANFECILSSTYIGWFNLYVDQIPVFTDN